MPDENLKTVVLLPGSTYEVRQEVIRLLAPFGESVERVRCDGHTSAFTVCRKCDGEGWTWIRTNLKARWSMMMLVGRLGLEEDCEVGRSKRSWEVLTWESERTPVPYGLKNDGRGVIAGFANDLEQLEKVFDDLFRICAVPSEEVVPETDIQAIVTPDGTWHEEYLAHLLSMHKGCLAVLCHLTPSAA